MNSANIPSGNVVKGSDMGEVELFTPFFIERTVVVYVVSGVS